VCRPRPERLARVEEDDRARQARGIVLPKEIGAEPEVPGVVTDDVCGVHACFRDLQQVRGGTVHVTGQNGARAVRLVADGLTVPGHVDHVVVIPSGELLDAHRPAGLGGILQVGHVALVAPRLPEDIGDRGPVVE